MMGPGRPLNNAPFLRLPGRLAAIVEAEFDVEEAVILRFR